MYYICSAFFLFYSEKVNYFMWRSASKRFNDLFIELIKPVAASYAINIYFILAVSALETSYGRSLRNNNYFGIKASHSDRRKFISRTKEFDQSKNKFITVNSCFRSYPDFNASLKDFCKLIKNKYPQCIGVTDHTVCALLQSNPKQKYSTDPIYASKIESLYYIFYVLNNRSKV